MTCKCYHAERNFLGKIGVCWGTKEREACSCGGDESKCDFYEDKRKKATPKTTNADRIRVMTDEELAYAIMCPKDIIGTGLHGCPYSHKDEGKCYECALKWLKEEDDNE